MNRHHQGAGGPIAPPLGLGLLCRHHQQRSQSSGFTLIESLVAIIIIAITIVSVTPPIFWATGTRVQNRRAEQATQLAQSEIDRVRTGIERGDLTLADLPPQATATYSPSNALAPATIDSTKLRSVSPSCPIGDGRPPISATAVIPVDTDPEPAGSRTPCKPEFYVQVFRGKGITVGTAGAVPDGMIVGVRVYSSAAATAPNSATLRTGLGTTPGKLRATNGLGTQQSLPLAAQYSVIIRSNTSSGSDLYRELCRESNTVACKRD